MSIPGKRVVGGPERLAESRALPLSVKVDSKLEFVSKVLDEWAYHRHLQRRFIEPGKPRQNAYIESFNGRFRDECLNEACSGPCEMRGKSLQTGARNITRKGRTARLAIRRRTALQTDF